MLTVIVFVHEMGHYLVARWNGVAIQTFSIGFGKELWGFNDKHGTRWRLSAVPLGGYVRFVGDLNATSREHVPESVRAALIITSCADISSVEHFFASWAEPWRKACSPRLRPARFLA